MNSSAVTFTDQPGATPVAGSIACAECSRIFDLGLHLAIASPSSRFPRELHSLHETDKLILDDDA
jgi:hypothetical protein